MAQLHQLESTISLPFHLHLVYMFSMFGCSSPYRYPSMVPQLNSIGITFFFCSARSLLLSIKSILLQFHGGYTLIKFSNTHTHSRARNIGTHTRSVLQHTHTHNTVLCTVTAACRDAVAAHVMQQNEATDFLFAN